MDGCLARGFVNGHMYVLYFFFRERERERSSTHSNILGKFQCPRSIFWMVKGPQITPIADVSEASTVGVCLWMVGEGIYFPVEEEDRLNQFSMTLGSKCFSGVKHRVGT